MGMILRMSIGSGLLCVTATGRFSLKEVKRTFLDILDAAAQHKTEKIIFDGRKLKGEPERIDRFFYGAFAAETIAL